MRITDEHFGGHMLLVKDMTDEGGPFQRISDRLGFTDYRYPGGTVTEALSPDDGSWDRIFGAPGEIGDPERVLTVGEAFAFAGARDASIRFVLPTEHFLTDGAYGGREPDMDAIDRMMDRVAEMVSGVHGEVEISHFEIGNEYWYDGSRMSASEYGRMANYMAKRLDEVISENFVPSRDGQEPPRIAIQTGAGWVRGANEQVLAELDMEARGAIDAVIAHFYPSGYSDISSRDGIFNNLDAFSREEGFRSDLDYLISEWNIKSSTETDLGMKQASALLRQFDEMIVEGVDQANVWGTNYKFLNTRLAYMSHNHADGADPGDVRAWLTPAGETYRMMRETLSGTGIDEETAARVERDIGRSGIAVHAYENEDRMVVFLASRLDEPVTLDIDPERIWAGHGHVSVTVMTAIDDPGTPRDEGDPESSLARAHLRHVGRDELEAAGGRLDVGAWGIVRVELTRPGVGVLIEGHDQIVDPDADYTDAMAGGTGDDTLLGHHGDDRLAGSDGADILDGGSGADSLNGGAGNDLLVAGGGGDVLNAGAGVNVLIDGEGAGRLSAGDDGNLFLLGRGQTSVTGGAGANYYHALGGEITIRDFDPDKDHLDFGGGAREAAMLAGAAVVGTDIVMTSGDGQRVVLAGAADRLGDLDAAMMGGMAEAERLSALATWLDGMTRDQVATIARDVQEAGSGLFGEDPEVIREAFSPATSWEINNVLNPDFVQEEGEPEEEETDDPATPGDPEHPEEPGDEDVPDEGKGDGKPDLTCFVATAAFGDAGHPDVTALRRFRDEVLVTHPVGRDFIRLYWRIGPVLARICARLPAARVLARILISGLVRRISDRGARRA